MFSEDKESKVVHEYYFKDETRSLAHSQPDR